MAIGKILDKILYSSMMKETLITRNYETLSFSSPKQSDFSPPFIVFMCLLYYIQGFLLLTGRIWEYWRHSSSPGIRKVGVEVAQSCPTLCNTMDYTVHGILQTRILEWEACPFSSGSSRPRNWTRVSCIAGRFFTNWAVREAQFLRFRFCFLCILVLVCFAMSQVNTEEDCQQLKHCHLSLFSPKKDHHLFQ